MAYETLKDRDYYLIIDKSGSMEESDTITGQTRFKYVEESVVSIARRLAQYDPDGITVIPFSGSFKVYDNTNHSTVVQIFQENEPMGQTYLAPPLRYVFEEYLSKKERKKAKLNGAIVLIITDGRPNDEEEVAKSIIRFTHSLSNGDDEFGISFLQVGKDAHATAYLRRLDDQLKNEGAKFDIVDTKTIDEVEKIGLLEALWASLKD